jgi:hypothetical protein
MGALRSSVLYAAGRGRMRFETSKEATGSTASAHKAQAFCMVVAFVAISVSGMMLPNGSLAVSAHHRRRGHDRPRSAAATDPLARGARVALGVNLAATTTPSLRAFSRLAGRTPSIVMWYQQWSEPLFYRPQMRAVSAIGAAPMITWDPTVNGTGIPLAQIAAGDYDRYIRRAARAARRWRRRIYVRFAHEMNLGTSAFGPTTDGNTPAAFIAAWRRVVDIFRRERATNVEWVWSPNVDCNGKCPFQPFYPGDAWVNWVALDGYNYAGLGDVPWETFGEIFGRSYRILTRMTAKPVMIGETGSVDAGGSKPKWIRGIRRALVSNFQRARVLVWFQRVKETDWEVNSSPASLAAFQALIGSPLFDIGSGRRR